MTYPDAEFCHLHVHSRYSFRDGLGHVEDLTTKVAVLGQPAIALTDHGVAFGMPDLFKSAKAARIKPIPGMEYYEAVPHAFDMERDGGVFKIKWADLGDQPRYYHGTLWVANEAGWRNLVWLHTNSFTTEYHPTERGKPLIDRASLETHSEGLMMGLGCTASRINQLLLAGREEDAYHMAKWNAEAFEGRCWMEIMGNTPEQVALQRPQRRLAARLGIPCVGDNDVHYLDRKDGVEHGSHHTLVKSRRFQKADTEESSDMSDAGYGSWYGSDGFFLKSAQEMIETGLLPSDLAETMAVLDRVDFDFDALPEPSPPDARVPDPFEAPDFHTWYQETINDRERLLAYAGDLLADGR